MKPITEDQKKTLIELYNKGVSLENIHTEVNINTKKVRKIVNQLIADGELTRRNFTLRNTKKSSGDGGIAVTKLEQIIALYNDGVKEADMAAALGVTYGYLNKIVSRLKKEGVLGKRKRKGTPRKKYVVKKQSLPEPTLKEGETIKCTLAVAKSCVYGLNREDMVENGLCRYFSITGKLRSVGKDGCKGCACTKYSKVSANNPKLVPKWEEI